MFHVTSGTLTRECSFFHDSTPSRPLTNRLEYFRIQFRFHKGRKNSESALCSVQCACHRFVKTVWRVNHSSPPLLHFRYIHPSYCSADVFTNKRILSDCPFKSNHRPAIFLILATRCGVSSKYPGNLKPNLKLFYPVFQEPRWHWLMTHTVNTVFP